MLVTLLELQRLKRLDRTGWTLRGIPTGAESVAAHSFGVSVAAMLLADAVRNRGVKVDVERVLRLALVHDWAEARTGDLPRAAAHYFDAGVRRQAERRAFDDIAAPLGSASAEFLSELHEDYEQRRSLEARLVKAADVIDLLAQALVFERAGARGLDEFWDSGAEYDFNLEGAAGEVADELRQSLLDAHHDRT